MTEVFTAEITIDHPVDAVWARLIDWDTAAQWMPGVDALRAQGPTVAGTTLVFTTRGKERAARIAALDPGRSITLRSVQGGVTADYVYGCTRAGRGDPGESGRRLFDDRPGASARPDDQIRHPPDGWRPARCVRRHLQGRTDEVIWVGSRSTG